MTEISNQNSNESYILTIETRVERLEAIISDFVGQACSTSPHDWSGNKMPGEITTIQSYQCRKCGVWKIDGTNWKIVVSET